MRVFKNDAQQLALAYHAYLEANVYLNDARATEYWAGQLGLYQQRTGIVMIPNLLPTEPESEGEDLTPAPLTQPEPELKQLVAEPMYPNTAIPEIAF